MKYKTQITLYNSYFDKNDRLTPKSILEIFQDVASIHAEDIGVGYKTMLDKNLYWILSRVKFDILKMPQPNQTVLVETWPHIKGRIDFDRDMKITSQSGEVLIIATSKWCVIDTVNRTLQRTENVNYNEECLPEKNYQDRFNKIAIPNKEENKIYTHTVRFCDLDHNQHMNNTNYANLVLNVVKDIQISHFEINYLNECVIQDEIDIYEIKDNNEIYIFGKVESKTVFVCYLK